MSHTLETLDGRPCCAPLETDGGFNFPLEAQMDLCSQAALEVVAQPVVFIAAATPRLVYANPSAAKCLGHTQQQLQSMSLADIAPQATSARLKAVYLRAMRAANRQLKIRTVYRDRCGSLIPVQCLIRAIATLPNCTFIVVGQPIQDPPRSIGRQLSSAYRDSLTLLPNRDWLFRQLRRESRLARQRDYHFAVLFVDIDRFKVINDSFGHLVGDRVLQAVARRLKASVRPNDAVARYGGDEFVVLMKAVGSNEDICRITERIGRSLESVGKQATSGKWPARVTASIGAAIIGGEGSTAAGAIERADRAMYRAKALGRNGQFIIDDSPNRFSGSLGIHATNEFDR